MILCSPAEPSSLISMIGATKDSDCETIWGADFFWITDYGVAVVQRKRFPSDFIASTRGDDRFAKEMNQFKIQFEYTQWRYLILELDPDLHGSVPWTTEGFLVGKYQGRGGISKSEVFGMIESLDHFYSVKTRWTNGLSETAEIVKSLYNWTTKPSHSSHLSRRQTPGKLSVENQTGDWREFILTGFPGIGPTLARKIIETEPSAICWKEGFDLESVPKLGKIRAKQLREALRPR